MQKITFESKRGEINGTLFIPNRQEKHPGVIFFHGSGSSEKNWVPTAEKLWEKGIAALTINFRGHSTRESLDKVTAYDGISDGLAGYDFLINQKGVDPDRIGICASSFGAIVGTHVTGKRKVKSLLLRAPALYKKDMLVESMGKILVNEKRIFNDMEKIQDTEMMKIILEFKGSLLVVASEKDDLIPASLSRAFCDQAKNAKLKDLQTIRQAPHSIKDPAQRKKLVSIITKWFTNTL